MHIDQIAQTRYTTKAFDPQRKIPAGQIDQLLAVLRHAPSSVNSQPWHFFIASTEESKALVAQGTPEAFAYNAAKIKNASHVIVLAARNDLDEAHLARILAQEEADGRFPTPEGKAAQSTSRNHYANLHRNELKDARYWMDKQVYIALGMLLLSAGTLGIDACPIEGFSATALDAAMGLEAQGLHSVVLVALGYRSEADFNAKLPKSRLPADDLFTTL